MIGLHETATDDRKKRAALKSERDRLFERFLKDPSCTQLALEIKTIDDQVAESMERQFHVARTKQLKT